MVGGKIPELFGLQFNHWLSKYQENVKIGMILQRKCSFHIQYTVEPAISENI